MNMKRFQREWFTDGRMLMGLWDPAVALGQTTWLPPRSANLSFTLHFKLPSTIKRECLLTNYTNSPWRLEQCVSGCVFTCVKRMNECFPAEHSPMSSASCVHWKFTQHTAQSMPRSPWVAFMCTVWHECVSHQSPSVCVFIACIV